MNKKEFLKARNDFAKEVQGMRRGMLSLGENIEKLEEHNTEELEKFEDVVKSRFNSFQDSIEKTQQEVHKNHKLFVSTIDFSTKRKYKKLLTSLFENDVFKTYNLGKSSDKQIKDFDLSIKKLEKDSIFENHYRICLSFNLKYKNKLYYTESKVTFHKIVEADNVKDLLSFVEDVRLGLSSVTFDRSTK